ncbi:unnamed protein product [Urochloa decumbens]|uniref:Laccase n=1 Tax=Urochloa decumbens TaxID=240449 RepID=A0ABC8WIW2_9POAL
MAGGRCLRCLSPACLFLAVAVALLAMPGLAAARTRRYTFNVTMATVTRLCVTKSVPTVNGRFPGPKIVVREGDRLVVQVHNNINNNVTFHWHGVRQLRSAWADGPSYITQCPIRPGQSYAYDFRVVGQRGTLWWHAHFSWLRATLYGPLVILPPRGVPYPFSPKPDREVPLMLGDWFNADPEAVIKQALKTGGGPNVSDAYTFNGLPGPTYNACAAADTFRLRVQPGRTYMLRIVNAALNDELFFAVANHTLTVVGADASYVKPFAANTLVISPGQTMDVLLTAAAANPSSPAAYAIAVAPYTNTVGTFDNTTAVAALEYAPQSTAALGSLPLPVLPLYNDTGFVANFSANFRSLASARYPARVPRSVDRRFFFAVGLGADPCQSRVNGTCQGPNGTRFAASMNNVSFAMPRSTSLLQAHYQRRYSGVLTANFPAAPPVPFNYTGTPPNNTFVMHGTRVVPLGYNTTVEVVLQDTSILGAESHPLHLHGYDFFVVGTGFGNYDAANDTAKYNLVDPVQRNTVSVPTAGWVAIRFVADNPGVWIMHCHLDVHLSWGLAMAWLVNDGPLPNQKLPPPPSNIPKC